MATLAFLNPSTLSLPRWNSTQCLLNSVPEARSCRNHKPRILAVQKKSAATLSDEDGIDTEAVVQKKSSKTSRSAASVAVKKAKVDVPKEPSKGLATRRKAGRTKSGSEEIAVEKKVRRKRVTKSDEDSWDEMSESEISENQEDLVESDESEEFHNHGGEDISYTYTWPPLVCCFGAAQHAFVPFGRPAHRLIDHEIHDLMKGAFWEPDKFVRASGGSAGSVALALANLGGKVAFMGKLGEDDFGRSMLYYMNFNNVQTRSVQIDSKRLTAVSLMKLSKRGPLRATCTKSSAEDCLPKSAINVDVLKEAKMFYFSTLSLLDQKMKASTMHALSISKKMGAVVFYDVNLPLPLWQSKDEAKSFIQDPWSMADIIEITKQEFEFLSGIEPDDDEQSKFKHYSPEVISKLWHENLKVLFITNGTSKIHFYTSNHDGAISGMEDAPITPYTSDMSASGDGIVAGIMKMLSGMPHLLEDKGYLEETVKYAIQCGVIDQWLLTQTRGFPPNDDMEDEVEPDENGIRSITEREFRTIRSELEIADDSI